MSRYSRLFKTLRYCQSCLNILKRLIVYLIILSTRSYVTLNDLEQGHQRQTPAALTDNKITRRR